MAQMKSNMEWSVCNESYPIKKETHADNMTEVFWSLLSLFIIINIILVSTYLWLYVKVKYQIWSQQPNLWCLQKEDLVPNNNLKNIYFI